MYVRCDNQNKTGADGGAILGQPRLFKCMGIFVLSPAHENQMRGYLVYVLIVKYLSHRFKFSHSILDWTALSWGLWTVIIYRDYIANRRSFIYCSLATNLSMVILASQDVTPLEFLQT